MLPLRRILLALSLVTSSLSIFLSAQVGAKEGSVMCFIRGRVNYPNGASVEGALVRLSPSAGGISQEAQTDKTGKFEFKNLSPIRYTVTVAMPGFAEASNEFDMSIASSTYDMVTLRPQPGAENVPPAGLAAVLPPDMPDGAKAEFNEGYGVVTSGKDPGKAIPHFKKAIDAYPKYAPSYLLLGTAYVRTNRPDEAIAPLQKAIELDRKSADAYIVLGEIYNAQKNFAAAEQHLSKAVELAPNSYDAQYQLGRALYYEQKAPEAQLHFYAALQAKPTSGEAHIMLGNVNLRLRDAEGALKQFQEGVRLDPKGPMAEGARQMIGKIEAALANQK